MSSMVILPTISLINLALLGGPMNLSVCSSAHTSICNTILSGYQDYVFFLVFLDPIFLRKIADVTRMG